RLPPLYATTEEGASYQRQKAKQELQELINQQIEEAISLSLDRESPNISPLLKKPSRDVVEQVSSLLKSHATNFDPNES
ncbi:MAG: late competence development ComFB family protein, partial [Kamptonema sp. SIO4C4]|nr:late competence development ComFB family protein [Kamptonema sp. SIO4C4]